MNDKIHFQIIQTPNSLVVEIPEVLIAVLEQDIQLKAPFESLSDGNKRNIIFNIVKIKNIDSQISRIPNLILQSKLPRAKPNRLA